MKKFIIFFLIVVIYRVLINFFRMYRANKYLAFFNDRDLDSIANSQPFIIDLLKKAGIKDSIQSLMEPVGFGHAVQKKYSDFDNMLKFEDSFQRVESLLIKAHGIYKKRLVDSINPVFWIESIIYLPKITLIHLGMSPEALFTKLIQIIYWVLTPVLVLFRQQLFDWIVEILNK